MTDPTTPHTTELTVDGVLARMRQGATLHYGTPPGKRRKGWWMEPGYTPIEPAIVDAICAIMRP